MQRELLDEGPGGRLRTLAWQGGRPELRVLAQEAGAESPGLC